MNTKHTFAAALVAAGLMAAPALAQDSLTEKAKTDVTDMAKDKAKSMMENEVTIKADKVMNKDGKMTATGDPLTIETPEKIMVATDGVMTSGEDGVTIMGDTIEVTEKPMMDTAAPATTVNIACPEGTSAQPDGTCMITGDYAE
ncbi:hypothetical protein [Litorimonas sp. WD9-15]|uniref:hypothetical protein n=1 Tax=Litorimonas sp. WD9-15 TaxID=3418716 RepID=UPI003D076778